MGRRRTKAAVAQEWRDKVRDIHGKWWYIARTDRFPYDYLNRTIEGFVGFRQNAAKFRTKGKAERIAFKFISENPELLGKIIVLEK